MTGCILIVELEQKPNSRFKSVDDCETFNNGLDNSGCDSEDVIFKEWLYNLNTPEFNKVNRS